MYSPRSPKSQADYDDFKQSHATTPDRLHWFDFDEETIVREFTHWVIIQNRFPYDNMARTNHLLVTRSRVSNLYEASPEIQAEFHTIMQQLATEQNYDARIENFPQTTSAKAHYHIHLVSWHNTPTQSGSA